MYIRERINRRVATMKGDDLLRFVQSRVKETFTRLSKMFLILSVIRLKCGDHEMYAR